MSTAAVILCGGKGERLGGVNKALIEIGGRTLIDRVMDTLHGCTPIVAALGREAFPLPATVVPVHDLEADYGGPLAGVAAAVDWLLHNSKVETVLTCAVDTPFFPNDFLATAGPLLNGADVVMGSFAGQQYPTNALWRLRAIADLPDRVRQGTAPHSLKRLAASLRRVEIDYAVRLDDDPFRNANTPEDLAFLRLRAGMSEKG